MFVSQERGASRKPFQKPNILRRKSKVVRLNAIQGNESLEITFDSAVNNDIKESQSSPCIESRKGEYRQTFTLQPKFDLVDMREICENNSQTQEMSDDNITIYTQPDMTESMQSVLNVESFLNDDVNKQNDIVLLDGTLPSTKIKNEGQQNWSLSLLTENSKDNDYYDGSQSNNIIICSGKSSNVQTMRAKVSSVSPQVIRKPINIISQEIINVPAQKVPVECNNQSGAVKLKCDMPNCEKSFWTEAQLQGHKNRHKKRKSTPKIIECPVKKTGSDGAEVACGQTFHNRSQLMKHLKNKHSPDDALYSCSKCDRRFFYAVGARSHAQTPCTRLYVCAWAGCGRGFRQPCRLREHARAHSGDRPYKCTYPECSWAFRSASKLMRHVRAHTGERRHECSACGRAFPRREHLRDHFTRHHTKHNSDVTPADCDVTSTNKMNKITEDANCDVGPKNDDIISTNSDVTSTNGDVDATGEAPAANKSYIKETFDDRVDEIVAIGPEEIYATMSIVNYKPKYIVQKDDINNGNTKQAAKRTLKNTKAKTVSMVNLAKQSPSNDNINIKQETIQSNIEESSEHSHSVVIQDVTEDERCARTHCTWPLQRTGHYSIEDETQVEQSESSESNIYTVRSDLFLHGNLLINEDSEFTISRAETSEQGEAEESGETRDVTEEEATLDALGLIDSHPTIDLMQEELMYADAVDESSFRVLLLNGEELS